MIFEHTGLRFEEMISKNQELTFEYLEKKFKDNNLSFDENKYKILNIINEENKYTNLGLLLSDQCSYTIKCAIFNGTNKIEFRDRKEFTGSVLKQVDDLFEYFELFNKISGKIVGLKRIDVKDYPDYSLREALLNAIIHRLSEASDNLCYEKKKIMRSWTKKAFFYGLFSLFNFS